jgi:hypothetical protein
MDVGCLLIVRTDLPPGEKLQNPPLMQWQYADGRPVSQPLLIVVFAPEIVPTVSKVAPEVIP